MTDAPDRSQRLYSAIQPTGEMHIGNYLGAIENWVALQERYECIYGIVDHHATTIEYDPAGMPGNVLDMAIELLASGVDPDKATLYVQSAVPEHTELGWIFGTVTMYGDLGRMTQFKDKSSQHTNNINVGLFTYPVLQTADILLYRAGLVPVGEDQVQHLELARDVARRWNRRYREGFFPQPKPLLTPARRIMGTDGLTKMSKSKGNDLRLVESSEDRWSRLRTAFSDPARQRRTDPGDPDICNIFTYHGYFSDRPVIDRVNTECRTAAIGCFDCKKLLNESMETRLGPIREVAEHWRGRPDDVREILVEGGRKCRAIARETMAEVRDAMGLMGPAEA